MFLVEFFARIRGVIHGSLFFALALLFVLCPFLSVHAADRQFDIFRPISAQAEPIDWAGVLRQAGQIGEGAGLEALSGNQRAAIAALDAASRQPSMATAVGLLAHFETFAHKDNNDFRLALIEAAKPVFLMADAARYELVLQTNKAVNAEAQSRGGGIAVSLRVGSTGKRFAQWQQWVGAGRPMQGQWTFTDPNTGKPTVFDGMPVDQTFQDAKLFKSDDDVTNWASDDMRRTDPSANESVNGTNAARAFAQVTAEILQGYPPEFRDAALAGRFFIAPDQMMVEFLSPTQAVRIMGTKLLRDAKGWNAPIVLTDKVHFLGEWILAIPQACNCSSA